MNKDTEKKFDEELTILGTGKDLVNRDTRDIKAFIDKHFIESGEIPMFKLDEESLKAIKESIEPGKIMAAQPLYTKQQVLELIGEDEWLDPDVRGADLSQYKTDPILTPLIRNKTKQEIRDELNLNEATPETTGNSSE